MTDCRQLLLNHPVTSRRIFGNGDFVSIPHVLLQNLPASPASVFPRRIYLRTASQRSSRGDITLRVGVHPRRPGRGAIYSDPQFSWKFEVAPGGMNFLHSRALEPQFEDDLFMGAATPNLGGGYLLMIVEVFRRRY